MSKAQDILAELRGWAGLDLDNPAYENLREDQREAIKAINSDMRELFLDSELGQRVLRTLIDWTVRKPTAEPHASPNMAYFREGQNDIVRCILAAIHNSEEGK